MGRRCRISFGPKLEGPTANELKLLDGQNTSRQQKGGQRSEPLCLDKKKKQFWEKPQLTWPFLCSDTEVFSSTFPTFWLNYASVLYNHRWPYSLSHSNYNRGQKHNRRSFHQFSAWFIKTTYANLICRTWSATTITAVSLRNSRQQGEGAKLC